MLRILAKAMAANPASNALDVLQAGPASTAAPGPSPIAVYTLPVVIGNITNWLVSILAVVATLFLTIGGTRYLMAGGDPSEIDRAKAAFKSAGIGYGLALLAPGILAILKSILGA